MTGLLSTGLLAAVTFHGIEIINAPALTEMLLRFFLNTFVVWIIAHFFYYPKSHRRDYYFTFMLISVSIFMLIYLMDGSKMKIGAALGLFAVFGILRYRTESVPIREMTYLFFLVALSVVNGMAVKLSIVELLVANLVFVSAVALCESNLFAKHISCKFVKYDNISLIVPERREEMKADLEKRLGMEITQIEIGSVDFLRDTALIKVFYKGSKHANTADDLIKMPKEYE
jgi:hypothetical protein